MFKITSLGLSNVVRYSFNLNFIMMQNRTLYASSSLGIDGFIATRDKIKNQFIDNENHFREKVKEYISNPKSMIFTDDLKNMIHLADNKDDIELVIKMSKKYNNQSKDINFGSYFFGPVLMRMFHFFNNTKAALAEFHSQDSREYFEQTISTQILMDLLFRNEEYQDIIDIYKIVKDRPMQQKKQFKNIVTLVFAACYRLNTPESFKECLNFWHELKKYGIKPTRRTVTFAAALALQQNSPHIALEIISTLNEQLYITVRNIRAMAFAELNRPEDVLTILRSVLHRVNEPGVIKGTFISSVIDKIQESIKINHRVDLQGDFDRITNLLQKNNQITNETLDEILCKEIVISNNSSFNRIRQTKDQSYVAATYSKDQRNILSQSLPRKGLTDLY